MVIDPYQSSNKILTLATAGLPPDWTSGVNHQNYPRVDYLELQRVLNTDIIDYGVYRGRGGGRFLTYIETQLRSDPYLAMIGIMKRRHYEKVFTMSERVGIPFAGMQRILPGRKQHVAMFTCWSRRQEAVITKLNLFSAMDSIIVKCSSLKDLFVELGAPQERIAVIPFGIDNKFFSLQPEDVQRDPFVLAVGEIRTRDYATFFEAVRDLPVRVVVAASGSFFAREKETRIANSIPDNVCIYKKLPILELKKLYSSAQCVVLPVFDLPYSAGVTSLLEAMSMERAVIVTRSAGLTDYVIDGQTGIVVDRAHVSTMKEAILSLLNHPAEARRLGTNARHRIDQEFNIDVYVERIAHHLAGDDHNLGRNYCQNSFYESPHPEL